MKRIVLALALSLVGSSAAFAGMGDISLPRLDFPTTGGPTVTQGCNDLTQTCTQN